MLISNGRIHYEDVLGRLLFDDANVDRDRITDKYRPQEAQFLSDIREARPRELRMRRRHERRRQQPMHDAPAERRAFGECVFHVQRVQVAREMRERVDFSFGNRVHDDLRAADIDIVEAQVDMIIWLCATCGSCSTCS